MEPHPIPQNITSFEFKLVGDMTLRQFLYLASGMGTAYLLFVFLASQAPTIAWPIILFSAFLGIAFAFFPIAQRPLDHWVFAFLKAVYSPTKRVWTKDKKDFTKEPFFSNRYQIFLNQINLAATQSRGAATIPPQILHKPAPIPTTPPVQSPLQFPQSPQRPQNITPVNLPKLPEELPTESELAQTVDLARQAQALQIKIIETERQINALKTQAERNAIPSELYTKQVNELLANLKRFMEESSNIKHKISQINKEPEIPRGEVKLEVIKPPKQKPTQITLTSMPNVINGIVVDAEGNYLESVIVVIHDKEGLPVRALKTNKLGQFTGSTPLSNGTYTMELEKDNLLFDMLQMELDGKVLPPLTIAAKKVVISS